MKGQSWSQKKNIHGIVFVLLGAVLIVAGFASWKQFERHQRISAEVAILEKERERVRKENESLKERIDYFSTQNFQEQESKERLNMRKDNEYVVDIERIKKGEDKGVKTVSQVSVQSEQIPNYKKWWAKLF